MTKYRVMISANIHPLPEEALLDYSSSNALYHSQSFEISGAKFSDVAPTIDGIYAAIQQVVEAQDGDVG